MGGHHPFSRVLWGEHQLDRVLIRQSPLNTSPGPQGHVPQPCGASLFSSDHLPTPFPPPPPGQTTTWTPNASAPW